MPSLRHPAGAVRAGTVLLPGLSGLSAGSSDLRFRVFLRHLQRGAEADGTRLRRPWTILSRALPGVWSIVGERYLAGPRRWWTSITPANTFTGPTNLVGRFYGGESLLVDDVNDLDIGNIPTSVTGHL